MTTRSIGNGQLAIGNEQQAIGNRQWAIGNEQLAMDKESKKGLLHSIRRLLTNCKLQITHCQLPIANCKLPIAYCLLAVASCLLSCNSEYVQKPRGYFEIELPQKKYQVFDQPGFPYTFEYPVYGQPIKDSMFFEAQAENPYWINIDFSRFDARIHLSYKEIGKNRFDSLVNDAFTMAYKQHTTVASAINREPFSTPNGLGGVYFTLKGNAATGNQFFVTDSVRNFLRGALYFNATPNADSLAPVNKFLREDVEHLINTLRWKTEVGGQK